jgi:hypothetical protein
VCAPVYLTIAKVVLVNGTKLAFHRFCGVTPLPTRTSGIGVGRNCVDPGVSKEERRDDRQPRLLCTRNIVKGRQLSGRVVMTSFPQCSIEVPG